MEAKHIAGTRARKTRDAPTPDKSDATACTCGCPVAGLDALTGEALCEDCAHKRDTTTTFYQAYCPLCDRTWTAHRLEAIAEEDVVIHNGLVHYDLEYAEVREVSP